MVTQVDKLKALARLKQRVGQEDLLEQEVPFEQIQTVPHRASKAIQHFLGSKSPKPGGSARVLSIRRTQDPGSAGELPVGDRSQV